MLQMQAPASAARPISPSKLFPTKYRVVRPARLLAALGLLLVVAAHAGAQEPAQRAELERFRDSLAGTVDSVGLLVLEKGLIERAKADRNDPMTHLRLGFLSLRLGELGGQSHFEDAASEFQWAIDLRPDWPYSHYGMGFAEYGIGDSQISFVTGIKTMLGKDALTRSATAFARSAEVDPGFDKGLVDLANTALKQRVNIKLGVALDALRRASSTEAASHPEVMLARGRVEREVGDGDSALVAFQGFLEKGDNRSLAQLELARTLFLLGRFDGVEPYFEGAASDDSETVAGYRYDLATIASDSVMKEFDGTSGSRRADYLKRFWSERDKTELRADGERLRQLYTEKDLLAAECLREDVWRTLDPPSLAAVVSTLIYEPRREDAGLAPRWPNDDVREAHDRMLAIWSDLEDAEGALALPTTGAPDPGIAWAVHRWASGRRLEDVLRGTELAAGDFVRRCKQVIDLLGQLTDAGDRDLQRVARKASDAVLRGVVAADRLD